MAPGLSQERNSSGMVIASQRRRKVLDSFDGDLSCSGESATVGSQVYRGRVTDFRHELLLIKEDIVLVTPKLVPWLGHLAQS